MIRTACTLQLVSFSSSFSITFASFGPPHLVLKESATLQRFRAGFTKRLAEENEERVS